MIELRWLEYESHSNPETGEHFSTPSTYRKLQSRTQVLQIGNGYTSKDGVIHEYQRPQGYVWSEWQDVPTVPTDSRNDLTKEK